jgi:hypothetical protein
MRMGGRETQMIVGVPKDLAVGAEIRATAEAISAESEMVVKVKEPLPQECPLLRRGQALFIYLHPTSALELTKALLERSSSRWTLLVPGERAKKVEGLSLCKGKLVSRTVAEGVT